MKQRWILLPVSGQITGIVIRNGDDLVICHATFTRNSGGLDIGINVAHCTGNRSFLDLNSTWYFWCNRNVDFVTSKFDVNLNLSLVAMVEALDVTLLT